MRPAILNSTSSPAAQLALLLVLCSSPGCKTHLVSQYTSPRIEGRVLDAQTRQPIADVRVRRPGLEDNQPSSSPPKGAELLAQPPDVRTDAGGTFALVSIKDIAFFRKLHWFAVDVSFLHPNYIALTTNLFASLATNTSDGQPIIRAGDILLKPQTK